MTKNLSENDQSASSIPTKIVSTNTSISDFYTDHYRNHSLRFVEIEKICIGEVFKDDERLAYCESVDIDSARQYCRQIVDEQLNKQSSENLNIKPMLDDFVKAMQAIHNQVDSHCQNLLSTHLKNRNQAIPIDELKIQGGFKSTTAIFLQYADWSRLLCDALAFLPPTQASGKDPYLSLVIHSEEHDVAASSGLSIALMPDIYKALAVISKL